MSDSQQTGKPGTGSSGTGDIKTAEILIGVLARMIEGLGHVAVGNASPIPGAAALLVRRRSGGRLRLSLLGSQRHNPWSDGGRELFDCAGQGRLDCFFLGGGQVDGQANINLVGIGDYPKQKVRFPGSFGSAYLYFVVPKVILFREEHSARVFVPKVDFISAPGVSPANIYRPGGPYALVTGRCVMAFDRTKGRFSLESVHPGQTLDDIKEHTGFDFDVPEIVPETPLPDAETLELMRGPIAEELAETYPGFAARVFGIESAGP